ncbi:polysaccharide deacetylase family protein [Aureimonas phyllosphaerae]|uniref:Polysaccharide deacetylase n=1 Tax=Aureimonas phyllosphaerae TaxID=1166078 RepID=A0A7W6BQD6_9HYPH|nr:polysaccharide deacetylase family protein [Aureimonas phyllosphaerae]MBB3934104.1 hypothetical protein [Aureimonas phyllosphaerae]MBB3958680.1 hypothetical protein [Aureimonas phyllosphaerae]
MGRFLKDIDRQRMQAPSENDRDPWLLLERRLAERQEAGSSLRAWWRDDDAARWGPQIARLLALAEASRFPVALATIPASLDEGLPRIFDAVSSPVTILQHGYRHGNEAREGERAVECGGRRESEEILADLRCGQRQLAEVFGDRFLPVMVPPWNRIEDRIARALPAMGYVGLSVFGCEGEGRRSGMTVANAHLDVLRWKGGARFAGEARLLSDLHEWLDENGPEAGAAFCLLTHHLDHDEETWRFIERLVPLLARWAVPVPARSVFVGGAAHE